MRILFLMVMLFMASCQKSIAERTPKFTFLVNGQLHEFNKDQVHIMVEHQLVSDGAPNERFTVGRKMTIRAVDGERWFEIVLGVSNDTIPAKHYAYSGTYGALPFDMRLKSGSYTAANIKFDIKSHAGGKMTLSINGDLYDRSNRKICSLQKMELKDYRVIYK